MKKFFLFFLLFVITWVFLDIARQIEAIEPTNNSALPVIQGIEYQSLDEMATLDIETNGHLDYITYELEDPYRIVIDPLDTVWCDYEESVYFDKGMVRSIKFVKGKDVKEGPGLPYYPFDFVAIELRSPYPYKLSEKNLTITVNIGKEKLPVPVIASEEGPLVSRDDTDRAKTIEEEFIKDTETAGYDLTKEAEKNDSINKELIRKRREINITKDKLDKKGILLARKELKLAKEKKRLKRDRARLKNEKDTLKKKKERKLDPRPVKDFSKTPLPPGYLGRVLTLDECIKIAISNNLSVRIAKERVKLAKMKVNEAFRELFPEASFLWDYTKGMITDELYRGTKFGVEFKQAISHGGEQMYLWQQTKINLKVAKENLSKAKEEIVFEVSKAYYELAKAANKRGFQKELLDDINADFKIAKKEYDFGLIPQIDFMNIESVISQAEHTLLSYENSFSLARLQLNKAMDIDIDADIKIESKMELKELGIDLNKCVKLALKFRPEYRISYLNAEVAKFTEKIAKSQTFPQIDIFGKYLRAAEVLEPNLLEPNLKNERVLGATVSLPFGSHTLDYQKKRTKLAPTVTTFESDTKADTDKFRLNFFDNMARVSNVADAAISYEEALDEMKKAEQTIHSDIREAFFNFTESKIKVENTLNNIELYNKELEVAKINKGLNEISFYDLIQVKIKLYNEKGAYTDILGDYYIAIARINKVIGLGGYFK